ncbi:MAG: FkbM family methyltransferase [Pseudomonadota bacterium]
MPDQITANVASKLIRIDPGSVQPPDFDHFVCANEYGFYSVPGSFVNRKVPALLAYGDVYEPNTLKLMRRLAGSGDVVSGGAFVGDFFPALSEAMDPGARLYSFEPNPTTYASALHTIALNDLQNVHLAPVAVGAKAGVLPLKVAGFDNRALAAGARILTEPEPGETVDVDVVTLDTLIPQDRHISILHLDIEGFERPALQGARALVLRCKPVIIVEVGKPRPMRLFAEFLNDMLGTALYRPSGLIERNAIFVAEDG